MSAADARIDEGLDALFAPLSRGVDAYLDWYVTVVAEYQRLAAAALGDFGSLLARQLDRHLFTGTAFQARLAPLEAEAEGAADAELRAAAGRLDHRLGRIAAVAEQREALGAALKARQAARIDAWLLQLQRDFLPLHHGL